MHCEHLRFQLPPIQVSESRLPCRFRAENFAKMSRTWLTVWTSEICRRHRQVAVSSHRKTAARAGLSSLSSPPQGKMDFSAPCQFVSRVMSSCQGMVSTPPPTLEDFLAAPALPYTFIVSASCVWILAEPLIWAARLPCCQEPQSKPG